MAGIYACNMEMTRHAYMQPSPDSAVNPTPKAL
jgi:hypothetical protein